MAEIKSIGNSSYRPVELFQDLDPANMKECIVLFETLDGTTHMVKSDMKKVDLAWFASFMQAFVMKAIGEDIQ